MDSNRLLILGLALFIIVIIAFYSVLRGKGKFSLKTPLGEAKAEGENPSPPSAVPAGVRISDAEAGKLSAHSAGSGGVEVIKVKTKEGLKATHAPSDSSPKRQPPA